MRARGLGLIVAAGLLIAGAAQAQPGSVTYTADGKLQFPTDYRTWVYLSTGMDMSYAEVAGPAPVHVFDNVFVNREAFDQFQTTGTWPDKSIFMLEVRAGAQRGSINKAGHFQTKVLAREVHVKDKARFSSGWGFFTFGGGEAAASALPQTSACNVCHEAHGAADTTFVQFYPTLLDKAVAMKTLSAAYLAEEKAAAAQK